MHLHENHYIKRAGVAGIRERAVGLNGADRTNLEELAGHDRGKSRLFGALLKRKE